jgi:hypothetical protein
MNQRPPLGIDSVSPILRSNVVRVAFLLKIRRPGYGLARMTPDES